MSLAIVFPVSGTTWTRGGSGRVAWSATGSSVGGTMEVALCDATDPDNVLPVADLAAGVRTDRGSLTVDVSPTWPPSQSYAIRVVVDNDAEPPVYSPRFSVI
ncbi:Ser-Thr-rich GPI-anchored membrane family protein [Nocardia sp. NPDC051570]|uniref:Ser-Thr-rich GPI-anchored membrane family protein n=1 Tax=Nocardia sp. NPDC051570 TaxID=3364324 RepID=UPI00378FBD66